MIYVGIYRGSSGIKMRSYEKGVRFERALVHKFWKCGWSAIRSAGSGSVNLPVPDVIAMKDGKIILIECKSTHKDRLSLGKAIRSLSEFRKRSGGRAYLAIKFQGRGERFFDIDAISNRNGYTISTSDDYLTLDTILGHQKIL